jgi:hypothetical protein
MKQTLPGEIQDKISQLLAAHRCKDILKKQRVVQISADVDVNEACLVRQPSILWAERLLVIFRPLSRTIFLQPPFLTSFQRTILG